MVGPFDEIISHRKEYLCTGVPRKRSGLLSEECLRKFSVIE
jgi:hypothetical protein